jgi:hypothetical protein
MKLRLETRPVSSLKPYEQNAKRHGDDDIGLILASINRFGFNDPIGILPDGTIVEGHGRYQAAQVLGMESVPVLVLLDFTPEQADLYRIAHNKITLSTTFDFERLAAQITSLTGEGIEFGQMGFADEVAENLLRMFAPEEQRHGRGGRPVPAEYDVIWDNAAQKKRFALFMRGLQSRYPDLGEGEALVRFITESGALTNDGSRVDTTGEQHVGL